jgi:arginase
MTDPIAIIGAPSGIGIRPYDDGRTRRLDLAPAALRDQDLATRLRADDLGDVTPPPGERDVEKPAGRARNEDAVAAYSRLLADKVAAAADGRFVLLLGGDCSILLGGLLGLRAAKRAPVGLVYVDGHADYGTLEESPSGSACSMNLALAVGRPNATPLARLGGDQPLVRPADVVHIGRRDEADPSYGSDALRASPALDLPDRAVRELGPLGTAKAALGRVTRPAGGFWIHLDVDVLDPAVMPAVDSPVPGGLDLDEAAALLIPLVHHPRALGLQLTIYDPTQDPDGTGAPRLAGLLADVFADTPRT